MRTLFALCLVAACTTGPNSGSVFLGSPIGKSFTFVGYTDKPADKVQLQVLDDPGHDPNNDANWTTIGAGATGTAPNQVNNSSEPLYSWTATVTPVPTATQAARWPDGGLVRIRAFKTDSSGRRYLVTFDDVTFSTCFSQHYTAGEDWMSIGQECAGTGGKITTLVSGDLSPGIPAGFLSKKGQSTVADTATYYLNTNAPGTLTAFKTKYQFPTGEVTATYYNDGDLGLGREMHCKSYGVAVACYVSNYSDNPNPQNPFPADPIKSANLAGGHKGAFATVAMVYDLFAAQQVTFIVYGATGALQTEAQLDSTGANKSVPNNCLSCHGIDSSFTNGVVANAKFLPFDPFSYVYPPNYAQYSFNAQVGAFRGLNQLVEVTNPAPATKELIDGMYAPLGVFNTAAVANNTFMPAAWNTTNSQDGAALYNGIVKVACRTCHVSAVNTALDFNDINEFSTLITPIMSEVCNPTTRLMPHAERAMQKFWASGARAYLTSSYSPATYDSASVTEWGCHP